MSFQRISGMPAKRDLVRHYRWLKRYGLNDSHSGNAPIKDGARIWITPISCCADSLSKGDLLAIKSGYPAQEFASLEAALHLTVYEANPEAAWVLHSHGPYSIAVSLGGRDFEPVDFEGFMTFPWCRLLQSRMTNTWSTRRHSLPRRHRNTGSALCRVMGSVPGAALWTRHTSGPAHWSAPQPLRCLRPTACR